jgi:hypothetical protein
MDHDQVTLLPPGPPDAAAGRGRRAGTPRSDRVTGRAVWTTVAQNVRAMDSSWPMHANNLESRVMHRRMPY